VDIVHPAPTSIPHHSIRQLIQPILGLLHRPIRPDRRTGIDQLINRQTVLVHRRFHSLLSSRSSTVEW